MFVLHYTIDKIFYEAQRWSWIPVDCVSIWHAFGVVPSLLLIRNWSEARLNFVWNLFAPIEANLLKPVWGRFEVSFQLVYKLGLLAVSDIPEACFVSGWSRSKPMSASSFRPFVVGLKPDWSQLEADVRANLNPSRSWTVAWCTSWWYQRDIHQVTASRDGITVQIAMRQARFNRIRLRLSGHVSFIMHWPIRPAHQTLSPA